MQDAKYRKMGKQFFLAGGIVGTALLVTALVLPSCGRHHSHERMSPERVKTMVAWKMNDFLDDIDANDEQRAVVTAEVGELLNDLLALRAQHQGNERVVRTELAKAEPDGERLHALFDEHADEMRQLAHDALDSGLEIWAVLDESQRAEVRERFDEHMERH